MPFSILLLTKPGCWSGSAPFSLAKSNGEPICKQNWCWSWWGFGIHKGSGGSHWTVSRYCSHYWSCNFLSSILQQAPQESQVTWYFLVWWTRCGIRLCLELIRRTRQRAVAQAQQSPLSYRIQGQLPQLRVSLLLSDGTQKLSPPNSNFVVSPSVLIYISAQCRAKRVLKMNSVLYFRWVHYGRDYQRRRGISRALDPNFSEAPFHGGWISIASSWSFKSNSVLLV